jgi:hypothetical protein
MTLTQFIIIANIGPVLCLIGLSNILLNYKSREPYIKLLGLLLFWWILSALGSVASRELLGINPNYSATVSGIFELPLVTLIYHKALNKKVGMITIIVWAIYLAFSLSNAIFFQQDNINSYSMALKGIFIIAYSIYYFYWLLEALPTTQLHRLPMFWINSAFIIYSSGNLFLLVFTSYLVNQLKNDLILPWQLHNALYIIEALMINFAVWLDLKNSKLRS